MNVLINWLRSVLLCWTYLVVFLSSATSMIPNQEQVRSKTPMGQKDTDFDDVFFLRTRSSSFVSSSQLIRPYSLSMNEGDYHYAPKPKHLRHNRLLRILGSSFDPFWMSIERPAEARVDTDASGGQTASRGDPPAPPAVPNYTTNEGFNFGASPELTEGAARYQRKLQNDAEDLDLSELPADVASTLRDWLVRSATCGMRYQWVKLAPVFWPRWLRHTDCEKSLGSRSCSFPSGMACRQAQTTQIKILAWHCWSSEERGGDGLRGMAGIDGGTVVVGTGVAGRKCLWRQVPYPVVTACKCSCK
ncbi:noggin-2-like [Salvelinus fontinalis]|uniref:noggin-2-like n=1 Tax=Salvelinus fontinalis TaxID=8038 RepID=UPI0024859E83|nr:noggin-2-like [Salvelinus fontinalis]